MQIFAYPNMYMTEIKDNIKRTAEIMKVLGHPVRLQILYLLGKDNVQRLSVSKIHELLNLTQPETSRHLTIMKGLSILNCEKSGGNSYYSINDQQSLIRCLLNQM